MAVRWQKPFKWLLACVASAVVLLGLTFAAFGFIVGSVPQYRVQLQDWINERSGLVVEFRSLSARLRLYGPELVFHDAVVRTPDRMQVLASAKRGSVAFDLWNSIASGRLTVGRFALQAPQIALIRSREGRIQLVGQSALPERGEAKPFDLGQLPTGRFHVDKAVVSFRDEVTGRGPWSVSGVSFDLERDSDSLALRGDASLPSALGRELRFSATIHGALEDSAALVSTFDVQGEHLDLAGWADVLPDSWPAPETGHGSLHVRGVFNGASMQQLAAEVDFASVTAALPTWATPLPVAAPLVRPISEEEPVADGAVPEPVVEPVPALAPASPAPEMMSYSRLALALNAQKLDREWRVSVSNLELARPQSAWRAAKIEAHWSRDAAGRLRAGGRADRIVLDTLWPLLAYLPESETLARIRALGARGTIENITADYAGDAASPTYSLEAQVHGLAFRPVERAPGLSGLSGPVELTQQAGSWRLAAKDARFELPRMFRTPLSAQSIEGTLRWQREDAGWSIGTEQLQVVTEDGRAAARLQLKLPRDGSSPWLQIDARGEDLEVSATHKYIPADKLSSRTLEWFDRAFLDGRVPSAQLVFSGPTRAFPFRNDEGTFQVRGQVEDALLDYQPGWAPAQAIRGEVEFLNEGMHIHASAATIAGLQVEDAVADIADFRQSRLIIKAAAKGELDRGLRFLEDSPLAASLGPRFAALSGRGAIGADVRLDLPLKALANRKITVTTRFKNATLSMEHVNAPVRSLSGTLTVRNTLIAAADLRAQFLGGVAQLSVRPRDAASSLLSARGQAGAAQLRALLNVPPNIALNGVADWQLTTTLGGGADADRARTVRIDSDLQGLAIGLPEPVGKPRAGALPLQLTLQLESDEEVLVRGSLGEVRSLVRVKRANDSWSLDRGGVRADGVAPALPNHEGVRIEGRIERFALAEWLALRGHQTGGRRLSDILHAANVRIGTFEFAGYRFADLRGILQATAGGWRVDVSGPNAVGQVLIPESFSGTQPLRATLERLVLEKPENVRQTDEAGETDPRELPNLQVYVADLRLGARTIGAVDLRATRVAQGIRFDSVTVHGESVRADGQGEWLSTPEGQRSSLKAVVRSEDVAATLRALTYGPFIEAKRGELSGDLNWPGGFGGNILEHASGTLRLHAENGQLVAVQPGAGRVLGLFSVAALPRRLALDFSDLTEKGLAFDTVHGDFELRDGNAYTSNLLLRGPAAEIGIAGRTGLGARDYDQTAVVTGNLGASLPVAGALAGGPAVGAALLLFSQVFKEPLKGITRGYYRITGPWDEPVIERVEASAVKVSEK